MPLLLSPPRLAVAVLLVMLAGCGNSKNEVYIEKPVDDAKLVAAINRGLARTFSEQTKRQSLDVLSAQFARLTPRQVEIFDLVAMGFTSQTIAARLDISTRTVESYRTQVMEKMQAESVAVLVRQAIRLGRIVP